MVGWFGQVLGWLLVAGYWMVCLAWQLVYVVVVVGQIVGWLQYGVGGLAVFCCIGGGRGMVVGWWLDGVGGLAVGCGGGMEPIQTYQWPGPGQASIYTANTTTAVQTVIVDMLGIGQEEGEFGNRIAEEPKQEGEVVLLGEGCLVGHLDGQLLGWQVDCLVDWSTLRWLCQLVLVGGLELGLLIRRLVSGGISG